MLIKGVGASPGAAAWLKMASSRRIGNASDCTGQPILHRENPLSEPSCIEVPGGLLPRERALTSGVATLSDAELLALLLGTGAQGLSVIDWAQSLLGRFAGLRSLLAAPSDVLLEVPGLGPARSTRLQACLELARRASEQELQSGPCFDNPEAVRRYLRLHLARYDIEVCLALFLDSRHHLRAVVELSQGTLNQATVYPREVVRAALRVGAGAVILAHNHPSGDAEPSVADEQLTRTLKSALALVDVRVLDHVVVAGSRSVSLAERGMM